jgi:tetraacyldisaccharide 4'-kinase
MPGYKQILNRWVERYLFYPNIFMQLVSILLFPLTIVYCFVVAIKRQIAKPVDFQIPIVSIGNIIVGGSGKTPVTISLASRFIKSAVILRGYGRSSKGLVVVSKWGKIDVDVDKSGDEAMVFAKSLPKSLVIVSEDRAKAIQKAKDMKAKIIFLDDAFSKYNILKYDILLRPNPKDEPTNLFCLPSGGYREPKMNYIYSNKVLVDGIDFKRVVKYTKDGEVIDILPKNTVLLSAISKPDRLLEYLPKNIKSVFFEDHHTFTKDEIETLQKKYLDYSIVTTQKDGVKLDSFGIDYILMELSIDIDSGVEDEIRSIFSL